MRTNRPRATAAAVPAAVFAAIILGLLSPAPACAQRGAVPDWNDQADPLTSALGLHYGRLGGHGLSFRLPVQWWLYFQASGGLWHTADRKQHNLGLELNYILRQDQTVRLFLAAGAGWFYDKDKVGADTDPDPWRIDDHWNTGFGVGVELLRGRRWSVLIEGDFMHDGKSGDTKVSPQLGVYYYW